VSKTVNSSGAGNADVTLLEPQCLFAGT
jgi:hypothetical protein